LLKEESQVKSDLANTPLVWVEVLNNYNFSARTLLFQRLFKVKASLSLFSDMEIRLARNWDRLQEHIRRSAYRSSGKLPRPDQEKTDSEENFLLLLLFYYLLLNDKPMQAFLSLSIGVNALFFDVDQKSKIKRN
jgi:hypothetical protein